MTKVIAEAKQALAPAEDSGFCGIGPFSGFKDLSAVDRIILNTFANTATAGERKLDQELIDGAAQAMASGRVYRSST